MGYKHIETVELTSNASNITFLNIPQDGHTLIFTAQLCSNRASSLDRVQIQPNGQNLFRSASWEFYNGAAGSVGTSGYQAIIDTTSNYSNKSPSYFEIHKYSSQGISRKAVQGIYGQCSESSSSYRGQSSGSFGSSAAITSLVVNCEFGSFVSGSSISLYMVV